MANLDRIQLQELLELGEYRNRARAAQLRLSQIERDPDLQVRCAFDEAKAEEYAAKRRGGSNGPKPVVFFEPGHYRLTSGFHRVRSVELAEEKTLECWVIDGDKRAALLFSAQSNREHDGLTRTQEDKRRAVLIILGDPEWNQWPNLRIADHCGTSEGMVRAWRQEVWELQQRQKSETEAGGHSYFTNGRLNVSGINKLASQRKPRTPDEQVAAAKGASDRHRPTWIREGRAGLLALIDACGRLVWSELRNEAEAMLSRFEAKAQGEKAA